MKILQLVVLLFIVVFLAASVLVAQVAFRVERTVLSYGFTYREMQRILAPLDDPATHESTIGQAFGFVQKSMSLGVPRELQGYIIEAAVNGFSPSWVKQTVGQWLMTTQQVLHGNRDTIEFPLSLSPFKSGFLTAVRGEFSVAEQMEISAALDEIPTTFDLADEIPEDVTRRILGVGRSMALTQVLLQYVVPGLLIAACFFHRRIGTGLVAVGLGLTVAGVPSLVVTAARARGIGRSASLSLSKALPVFLKWVADGVGPTVEAVVSSGRVTALLVTISGVVFLSAGLYLVIAKRDPRIHLGGN
jgi:hypothetical protein